MVFAYLRRHGTFAVRRVEWFFFFPPLLNGSTLQPEPPRCSVFGFVGPFPGLIVALSGVPLRPGRGRMRTPPSPSSTVFFFSALHANGFFLGASIPAASANIPKLVLYHPFRSLFRSNARQRQRFHLSPPPLLFLAKLSPRGLPKLPREYAHMA